MNCLSKVKNLSSQTTLFKRENIIQEIEMGFFCIRGENALKNIQKQKKKKKKGNQIKATTILRKLILAL